MRLSCLALCPSGVRVHHLVKLVLHLTRARFCSLPSQLCSQPAHRSEAASAPELSRLLACCRGRRLAAECSKRRFRGEHTRVGRNDGAGGAGFPAGCSFVLNLRGRPRAGCAEGGRGRGGPDAGEALRHWCLHRGTGKLSSTFLWVHCMSTRLGEEGCSVQCIVCAGRSGANALQGSQKA